MIIVAIKHTAHKRKWECCWRGHNPSGRCGYCTLRWIV